MEIFKLYFSIGKEHILDYAHGYDHILFVVSLCVGYSMREWKRILVLITAFTLGHSVSLTLATLQVIGGDSKKIEFFIPVTIFITACVSLFQKKKVPRSSLRLSIMYFLVLFFGLIHGMGFSTYLQAMLGKSKSIIIPLLAFNLGLELGQIIIIFIFAVLSYLFISVVRVPRNIWRVAISSCIAGASLLLASKHVFW